MKKEAFREVMNKVPRRVQNSRAITHAGLDIMLWAGMLSADAYFPGWLAPVPIALAFAVFSFRAFGMMHDAVHSAVHTRSTVNLALGTVYGVFCFLPFRGWRDMHIEHHRWTGNIERDPTSRILVEFERAQFKMPKPAVWAWRKWVPLLGFMQHVVFWRATVTTREFEFLVGAVLYLSATAYVFGSLTLGLGILAYLCLVETVNLPHHLGIEQEHGDVRFPTSEQDRFARSCLYPPWFAHYVLLNFNLHSEHHLYPAYPWYQLDRIREEVLKYGPSCEWCQGNAWILEHRQLELEFVLLKTFRASNTEERKAV